MEEKAICSFDNYSSDISNDICCGIYLRMDKYLIYFGNCFSKAKVYAAEANDIYIYIYIYNINKNDRQHYHTKKQNISLFIDNFKLFYSFERKGFCFRFSLLTFFFIGVAFFKTGSYVSTFSMISFLLYSHFYRLIIFYSAWAHVSSVIQAIS